MPRKSKDAEGTEPDQGNGVGFARELYVHVPVSAALREELEAISSERGIGLRAAAALAGEALAAQHGTPAGAASLAQAIRMGAKQRQIEFHQAELAKLTAEEGR